MGPGQLNWVGLTQVFQEIPYHKKIKEIGNRFNTLFIFSAGLIFLYFWYKYSLIV